MSREHAIRVDADGVFHLAWVKLTDHRRAAEETVDRVMRALGKKGPGSKTAVTPLSL
jgi:glycerol-3-phosphate dehydrogenase